MSPVSCKEAWGSQLHCTSVYILHAKTEALRVMDEDCVESCCLMSAIIQCYDSEHPHQRACG